MQEIIEQMAGHIRGVWRFRWYIYVLAWPICIGGWLFVNQMPDEYEAKARVFVDTSSALRPLLRGLAVQSPADQGLQMMTRTLMSRSNLEKVARMTDMDLNVNTPEEMDILIKRLSKTIKFTGGARGEKMYSISYIDNDPQLAKDIVQSLLTIFVESTLGGSRKDSDSARKFIAAQIKEYEQRLIEAESRVKDFKRKNAGMMPGDGQNYFSRIGAAKTQLMTVELELKQAKNLRDELKRQVAGEEPVFGIMPSASKVTGGLSHPLDLRISALDERLDDLLLKYTSKHPDVVNAKSTKKRLEEKRDKDLLEMQEIMPNFQQTTLNQNPVYQQLRISLGQAEAQIASLLPRVKEYRIKVEKLSKLANTIPQIEADLKNLNRDYNINKKNYEQLLARRESARLSSQAESAANDIKFRVIDPPLVPFEAQGPNRPLFESVVLLGGLIAGLAFAFFLSQIKPMFDTPKRLQEAMKRPVLGYVSRVWTEKERKRRRLDVVSFSLVGAGLLVLFGGMMIIEMMGVDLIGRVGSGSQL